jgi:glycine cleavage system H protein
MNFPENLYYTKDHEWISFDEQYALIGITDFAQKELGDIVFLDIPSLNKTVNKEEIFGTVEAVKTVSDLYMPVSGTVIETNPKVEKSPELVNQDPYGSWIIKIKLTELVKKEHLLTTHQYQDLVG